MALRFTHWPNAFRSRHGYAPSLVTLFAGFGMLVARSDWAPDTTDANFEAGDKCSSHWHLDQNGAYIIHKRGSISISRGSQGSRCGPDPHTSHRRHIIAHNKASITDPDDDVCDPQKHA